MTLRTRLILAFVALSVVPLCAVTWYSYVNSARAMQDVAARGADILTSELRQRMTMITAQLSKQVESVMDIEGDAPVLVASAERTTTASPAANGAAPTAAPTEASAEVPSPPAAAAPSSELEEEVAERLGDAAMLLKNVQLRPMPGARGRQQFDRSSDARGRTGDGRGRAGDGRGRGFDGRGRAGDASASPVRRGGPMPRPLPSQAAPAPASAAATAAPAPPDAAAPLPAGQSSSASSASSPSSVPSPPTAPAAPPPSPAAPASVAGAQPAPVSRPAEGSGEGITIDLAAIRRQMFREIIPPDRPFEEMTQAERQRVIAEVNQRLLGIEQGLKLGAAELEKQANEARREAEAPAKPAAAPAPKPAASRASSAQVTRRLAMSGNRLNISREQNGVVRQIDAELDMRALLETVFSATPRDAGEIPFAIDPKGQLFTPSPDDRAKIEALGSRVTDPKSPPGTIRLPEWIVVTAAGPIESDLKLGIARPVGDALTELRSTALRSTGLGIGFILITLIGIVPISSGLTRSLTRLNDGVRRIAAGDYAARLPVLRHDEVGQLAQSVNQMAEAVEQHKRLALQQERLARELELGREIQDDMLPHAPLQLPRVDVYGSSTPAGEVGGDYFNYFEIANGQVALLIGDVSGKGVAAALLMANIQASLRTRLVLGQPLTQLAEAIDSDIQANTPEPVYATLFLATFDPGSALLRYVNAGHNPPVVRRRSGQLERLAATGLPIGLLGGRGYGEGSLTLAPGDVLFCYTDGCVEALNERGEMFGIEALERDLQAAGTRGAGILDHMDKALGRFRGSHPPDDDATMMVAEVKPEVPRA